MIATRSNGWIGVDIGTRTVKLAQVVCDQQGFRILDAAIVPRRVPWSPETISTQRPVSTQAEILTARSIASNTKGVAAACCATTALCSMTSIVVDRETLEPDPEELAQTLSLPDNTQAIVDYCLASSPPRNQHDAIVFAISEPWSEQLAGDVQEAGFQCHAIDAVPLALARSTIIDSSTPRNRCVAVIDLGYSTTTFVVARDGEPCFVRSMDRCRLLGFEEILINDLRIDRGQAERLLVQIGFGSATDNPKSTLPLAASGSGLKEILSPPLADLIEEIKRTFVYLQTHQATRVPNEIKLVGGGACVPGIEELLSDSLGIPVHTWQPSYANENVSAKNLPLLAPAIAVSMLPWEARS